MAGLLHHNLVEFYIEKFDPDSKLRPNLEAVCINRPIILIR